jgi:hypothetical protein
LATIDVGVVVKAALSSLKLIPPPEVKPVPVTVTVELVLPVVGDSVKVAVVVVVVAVCAIARPGIMPSAANAVIATVMANKEANTVRFDLTFMSNATARITVLIGFNKKNMEVAR